MQKDHISIGEIGDHFRNFKKINFNSNESLLDYDVIFLDLNYISYLFNPEEGKSDELKIDVSFEKLLLRKKQDFEEFLKYGKKLITYLPRIQYYKLVEGNYLLKRGIHNIRLLPFLHPITTSIGENIEIVGKTKFTSILNKYLAIFFYKSYFPGNIDFGRPLARIRNTDKIIAFENENIIILPSIMDMLPGSSSALIDNFGDELITSLYPKEEFEIPVWTNAYYLSGEQQSLKELADLNDQKEKLEKNILLKEEDLNKVRRRKMLFFGTGILLENCIEELFKELGFAILQKENSRDDLILEYGNKIAIVEVKGVTKSSTEEHSVQLEKWVSEYTVEMKKVPKGILVVNAFREIELDKRSEETFPNQMVKYSKNRDHCLISGIQLLGLYFDFHTNPSRRMEIIDSLFKTVGVYEGYKKWDEYIVKF